MSGGTEHQKTPRAMIHKRIIDAAAAQPDAALAEIAGDVPGASTDLVERVLDEYGDPANEAESTTDHPVTAASTDEEPATETESTNTDDTADADATGDADQAPAESATAAETPAGDQASRQTETEEATGMDAEAVVSEDHKAPIDPDTLTEKRRETLRAINAYPEASQRDLAEKLGVTAATISQRVNGIEGFEWANRADFVTGLFEETRATFEAEFGLDESTTEPEPANTAHADATATNGPQTTATPDTLEPVSDGGRTEYDHPLEGLEKRVATLEAVLEGPTTTPAVDDPELLSKILHACLDAETISTEEEHRIIQQLLT